MKIVVVGGNGTIGSQVVKKLSPNHEIIIASRTNGDYKLDMTSLESIKQMYEDIGKIDAVVSAAGSTHYEHLSEMTPELNEIGVMSKIKGQINLVLIGQHYINDGGSFTLTSGILMDDPILQGSSAAMANGAIAGFVKSASIELKRDVRINAVSPNLLRESIDVFGDYFKGFNPVPGEQVANAYLKSVEGAQTGQVYKVY